MKSLFILFTIVLPFAANAARVECKSAEVSIVVESTDALKVTYMGETVAADGILTAEEVDLIAKFKSIGEMTLFAKVGKVSPDNYAFINGKRISVLCR